MRSNNLILHWLDKGREQIISEQRKELIGIDPFYEAHYNATFTSYYT